MWECFSKCIFSYIYSTKVPITVLSGGWKEQFLWLPAHLIQLTLKKTERLWQTGQRKIVPWILIVEVNEQIGLEVCHLSVSRDAWVWIHPSNPVSPVTSWRKQARALDGLLKFHQLMPPHQGWNRKCPKFQSCIYKTVNITSDSPLDNIREHPLYVYLFKYSWKDGRNSVPGLWFTPAISLCQHRSRQYPPAYTQRQE